MARQVVGIHSEDLRVVDHINHNGLDNRRSNLRICTVQENLWNRRKGKGTKSRYIGVRGYKEDGYQIALDTAEMVSEKIPIAVLPAVWFGYTVSTLKKCPGTITINPKVLIDLMYEICKSLIDMGLDKIMILNGHGNNPGALDVVTRKMGDDFDVPMGIVNIFSLWDKDYINNNRKSKEGGIGHAGEIETSVMLYLNESLVDMNVADDADIMKSRLKYSLVDFFSNRKNTLSFHMVYRGKQIRGCWRPI